MDSFDSQPIEKLTWVGIREQAQYRKSWSVFSSHLIVYCIRFVTLNAIFKKPHTGLHSRFQVIKFWSEVEFDMPLVHLLISRDMITQCRSFKAYLVSISNRKYRSLAIHVDAGTSKNIDWKIFLHFWNQNRSLYQARRYWDKFLSNRFLPGSKLQ